MPKSIITATGSYIPDNRVPNTDFLQNVFFDSNGNRNPRSNQEIIRKLHEITGSKERRRAPAAAGAAVSLTKMDSAAASLPASIRVLKGAIVRQPTPGSGLTTAWHNGEYLQRWRRNCLLHQFSPPTGAWLNPHLMNVRTNHMADSRDAATLTIREGEGIALFVKADLFEREQVSSGWHYRPWLVQGSLRIEDGTPLPAEASPYRSEVYG